VQRFLCVLQFEALFAYRLFLQHIKSAPLVATCSCLSPFSYRDPAIYMAVLALAAPALPFPGALA